MPMSRVRYSVYAMRKLVLLQSGALLPVSAPGPADDFG